MQVVSVDGVHLHCRIEGPEGAPSLIFANSLGTDFRVWDKVMPRLPAGLRVLRYDKRGHGLSDSRPAPYKMDDHVGDLIALMDHFGLRDALIVGLSVGGLIAQSLAAARPDLARALVLLDTAHKIGTDEIWNERIAAVEKGGIESLADAVMIRWFTEEFRAGPELALWRNMLTRTPDEGYAGTSAAIRDTDLTEVAKALTIPVLCLVGAEDGSTPPALMRETADLIPGAGYAVIEGAGHLPCVEQPEALARHLNAFMKETGHV